MAAAKKKDGVEQQTIKISELNIETVGVRIVGLSPLITHKWAAKSILQMESRQQGGEGTKIREVRNPEDEFEAAKYYFADGKTLGFPLTSIKNAIVAVAHVDTGVPRTIVRRGLFIHADDGILVKLDIPSEPKMRTDMVRIGRGTSDLRYRPEHVDWAIDLVIDYDTALLNPTTIFNLIERAGFGIGIGEWRPEKDGEMGRFRIDRGQS